MEILLAALVVAAVVAALAWPLWRPTTMPVDVPRGPAARAAELRERKELTYAAIRELGLDYRTGKLTHEDYEEEVARLKREAIRIVEELQVLDAAPPRGPEGLEAEIARRLARLSAGGAATGPDAEAGASGGRFCTHCGRRATADDRFCAGCGTRLPTDEDLSGPSTGRDEPDGADDAGVADAPASTGGTS